MKSEPSLIAMAARIVNAALIVMKAARAGDRQATRRELRGLALVMAALGRQVGEHELAAVIERKLYVTSGLGP